MAQEITEDLFIDDGGVNSAMRAEAASQAQAANNWMLAALITTNGGASLALLSHADGGQATIIALGLYMLGVIASLIAGRLAANSAYRTEALFVCMIALHHAGLHNLRAARTADEAIFSSSEEYLKKREQALRKEQAHFDESPSPGLWLGMGVMFFFLGCVAAGFALF